MAESHQHDTPLACPLCQADGPTAFYHENGYQYWRCRDCRLLFLWPTPASPFLHDHYQEYLPVEERMVRQWGLEMGPIIKSAAGTLDAWFPDKGRVLDIGCGYGFFLEEMGRRGWEVEGVELSRPAAAIARDKTKAPVHSCAVEDMPVTSRFDVVTMFYVIEHVAEPLAILRAVRKILKPGGVLWLRYPNTAPLLKLSGRLARRFTLMQAPSHLYDYSQQAMALLLQKAGFADFRTRLDANTRPTNLAKRLLSCYIGNFAVLCSRLSQDRLLIPGYSRTTCAALQEYRFTNSFRS